MSHNGGFYWKMEISYDQIVILGRKVQNLFSFFFNFLYDDHESDCQINHSNHISQCIHGGMRSSTFITVCLPTYLSMRVPEWGTSLRLEGSRMRDIAKAAVHHWDWKAEGWGTPSRLQGRRRNIIYATWMKHLRHWIWTNEWTHHRTWEFWEFSWEFSFLFL